MEEERQLAAQHQMALQAQVNEAQAHIKVCIILTHPVVVSAPYSPPTPCIILEITQPGFCCISASIIKLKDNIIFFILLYYLITLGLISVSWVII